MVKGQSASLRMRGLTQLQPIRASLATELARGIQSLPGHRMFH